MRGWGRYNIFFTVSQYREHIVDSVPVQGAYFLQCARKENIFLQCARKGNKFLQCARTGNIFLMVCQNRKHIFMVCQIREHIIDSVPVAGFIFLFESVWMSG